jgi:Zn-finger nucleic acid-binding protein
VTFGLCPACDKKVDVGSDPDIGLHCRCESCLGELVVVWLNPIELSLIDYEEYRQFDDDPYHSNFQKIRRNKGEYYAHRKTEE